ncbi:NACHT, LRR and PYD domains-containing protein 12-like [Acropora muricata]|uniref:NACHT, LRR and PYD domains-containing protein 12-like n=1 Tax=Acropora muricata TaxID=159855 RepID=UPI0034E486BF
MDNLLIPSTFNKLGLLTLKGWIGLGSILPPIFLQMHFSEYSSDFRCDVKGNIDKDFVRGKCFDQYQKQNNKLGVPLYAFIMVNVWVIPAVSVIYSQCVKSTVTELERRHQDAERGRSRRLFLAYFCQLAGSCALKIIFIVFLEIELFYPRTFPADFNCSTKGFLPNQTKSTNSVHCFTQRAADKNFWTKTVKMANGIFAFFAFLEILWILSRARNGMKFMDNWQFYADHLTSEKPRNNEMTNSSEQEEHPQAQNDFHSAIQTLKRNCLQDTEELSDFKHPFGQPNHGEGHIHDLTIDKIYVHVVIVEGRAYHEFAQDRWEQLQEYPPDAKNCKFAKPEDILDENHTKVLVVGRPGIGKTSLSTKLLRLWASGEAFNGDENFNFAFLVKFRRFNNDNANLSLRDLMACSETVHSLDDALWDFIKQEPTKVLLIFDGLDECSRKECIKAQEGDLSYKNCVEEKMPLSVLYNKLAEGKLFRGASILTTTRPTAVKSVHHVRFQRTVEIRGFTSDDVKEYVKNFTRGNPEAMEKMWEHIKSNINLFSFCYIPMNCFLICHCLLQIILSESFQALPTKMTDIYKMTVKMFLFNHNREGFSPEELARLKSTHMDEPFDKLPKELQKIFNSLGEIAFKGIDERRLLFESSEVSDLEDCGLLHKLPDLKRKALDDPSKSQFCFTHLTVQEFFAAKHLVDTETDEGIERFVCNHINDGTWQVVLQFAAGLLKSSLSSDIFIKLLPESTKKKKNPMSSQPKTVTTWPATKDKHLAVQVCKCLYEINDEQQPVLQNKLEEIKFNAVELSRCSLAPIDVAAVLHFLENAEEVLYINLRGNISLGDLGANEVKKFLVNRERKLQHLNLYHCYLTDNAAKDLVTALRHSNCKLKSLDLSENNFTNNTTKDFAAALKHSNCKLESLDLSHNECSDNAAKDFAAALKHSNCKLESLNLSGNKFTDNAAKDFAAALKHSNCKLESLNLSGNKFTDNAAKDFAAALKHSNCKLKSLNLGGHKFTDNAAKDFAAALKHSNCKLESLELSGNDFTDNAAKDFAAALQHSNCKLESLHLNRNNFSDNAAKDFAAALQHSNCKLESLHLNRNNFSDNAAKDLAAAIEHRNCKLKSLGLFGHLFTDNAAEDFAAALKHSNCKLKSLYFTCRINLTEEGRNYLTDAGKQSNCKVLTWKG